MDSPHHIVGCRSFGLWESNHVNHEYYAYYDLNSWIEILAKRDVSNDSVGIRWTINHWAHYQDTSAYFVQHYNDTHDLWKVELCSFAKTGWRDGRYGGPNAEQPSNTIWTLWAVAEEPLQCFSQTIPSLEFAVFLKTPETLYFDNNGSQNYIINLCP